MPDVNSWIKLQPEHTCIAHPPTDGKPIYLRMKAPRHQIEPRKTSSKLRNASFENNNISRAHRDQRRKEKTHCPSARPLGLATPRDRQSPIYPRSNQDVFVYSFPRELEPFSSSFEKISKLPPESDPPPLLSCPSEARSSQESIIIIIIIVAGLAD